MPRYRRPVQERFWSKVNRRGPVHPDLGTRCWVWTRYHGSRGYGGFHFEGRCEETHRISWEFAYGPIPAGLWVLHHCDNRSCVRPDHLWLGTHLDNIRDATAKGRMIAGILMHPESVPRGEARSNAKLTNEKVREIRRLYTGGGWAMRPLAHRFGVSFRVVQDVLHGRTWKHVQ